MSLLGLLASTRTLRPSSWTFSGSWVTDTMTATTAGSTAVQDLGALSAATITMRLTATGAAGLMVRVAGSSSMLVEWDPTVHVVRLHRVTDGARVMLVEAPAPGLNAGVPVDVRVDVDGPHVTLYAPGGARLISASAYTGATSAVLALTALDGAARFENVTVGTLRGPRINWPVFSHRRATADIELVPGSWEDTDINNPNVVWDPIARRWVMYYTGYSASKPSGDDGVQMAGIAYAPTLDGPWTKEPANPVISDLSTGAWSQNGGMERLPDRTWLIAANINKGTAAGPSMGTWFYSAPAPSGPWTRYGPEIPPYAGDPFLRWNQTTGALEHWAWVYGPGGRVGARWTSTDQGKTWSGPVQIVPRPPINGVNSGEQAIFVPPGKEGKEWWVTTDFYPRTLLELGRGMVLGMTPDAGATWYWHVAQTPAGSRGWDSGAAFDSTLVHDPDRGRLYLYHSGSTERDSGVLGMSIQIGHCWAEWDHTTPTIQGGAGG